MSQWGAGAHPGQLVVLTAESNSRIGHCWMRGRILDGDLAMVVAHAGDYFWSYKLVNYGWIFGGGPYKNRIGYNLIEASEFGAYVTGQPYKYQPTTREMHLLLAGEKVALDAEPMKLAT